MTGRLHFLVVVSLQPTNVFSNVRLLLELTVETVEMRVVCLERKSLVVGCIGNRVSPEDSNHRMWMFATMMSGHDDLIVFGKIQCEQIEWLRMLRVQAQSESPL